MQALAQARNAVMRSHLSFRQGSWAAARASPPMRGLGPALNGLPVLAALIVLGLAAATMSDR
jgi:hypothetical protein